jgi:hypothetical protein
MLMHDLFLHQDQGVLLSLYIERRAKKLAKLHFACQGRGEHCLYNRTFFTMKTRNPRIWIHLMFLALQVYKSCVLYLVIPFSESNSLSQDGTVVCIT